MEREFEGNPEDSKDVLEWIPVSEESMFRMRTEHCTGMAAALIAIETLEAESIRDAKNSLLRRT